MPTVTIIEKDGEIWATELHELGAAVQEMGAYHALAAEYVTDGRGARLELLASAADDRYTYYAGALLDAVTGDPTGIVIEWDEERP